MAKMPKGDMPKHPKQMPSGPHPMPGMPKHPKGMPGGKK